MNEDTILKLLSQFVKQLLEQFEQSLAPEDLDTFAERVADAAWNALLLFLRHSLGHDQPAILEEVGRFERSDTGVNFEPAASLVEAASLSLESREGQLWLADRALFYLDQGVELLEDIPEDLELKTRRSQIERAKKIFGSEEKILRAILGEKIRLLKLSDAVHDAGQRLERIESRLRPQGIPSLTMASRRGMRPWTPEAPVLEEIEKLVERMERKTTESLEPEHESRGEAEAQD